MNYLLDRRNKKRKMYFTISGVFLLLTLIYFRISIFSALSSSSNAVFRPFVNFGNNVSMRISNIKIIFLSKESLKKQNDDLVLAMAENSAKMANYNTILDENLKLKEILGRTSSEESMIVASILSKPNQSPYDTLVIDAGANEGVVVHKMVFALGNIPIGRIAEVFDHSAKVLLFSNWKEETEVVVSGADVFMQAVGRGGGNFEMILPRDFEIEVGTDILLPGIRSYVLGNVATIISDPRESSKKALLRSPVNIQQIRFVQVEK